MLSKLMCFSSFSGRLFSSLRFQARSKKSSGCLQTYAESQDTNSCKDMWVYGALPMQASSTATHHHMWYISVNLPVHIVYMCFLTAVHHCLLAALSCPIIQGELRPLGSPDRLIGASNHRQMPPLSLHVVPCKYIVIPQITACKVRTTHRSQRRAVQQQLTCRAHD